MHTNFQHLISAFVFSLSQRLPRRELGWPNGATLDMLSDEHMFDSSPEKCLVHGLGNDSSPLPPPPLFFSGDGGGGGEGAGGRFFFLYVSGVEELETLTAGTKPRTSHHRLPGGDRRGKNKRSTIFLESRREGPSSVRRTLELIQRQCWGNIGMAGWSALLWAFSSS